MTSRIRGYLSWPFSVAAILAFIVSALCIRVGGKVAGEEWFV